MIYIDTSAGGSYIQAAIESWGISDEQLIKNVACRMRDKLSGETGMTSPPYIDDLETSEEPRTLSSRVLGRTKCSSSEVLNLVKKPCAQ